MIEVVLAKIEGMKVQFFCLSQVSWEIVAAYINATAWPRELRSGIASTAVFPDYRSLEERLKAGEKVKKPKAEKKPKVTISAAEVMRRLGL
jgi:hypothetical protein